MRTLIIVLFALKPVTFWYVNASILGLGFFELLAVAMNALLVLAILNGMVRRQFSLIESSIDLFILLFIVWCMLLIMHPQTILKEAVRLVLPLFNFMVICRYSKSKKFILRLLFWVLVGFSVPIVASAVYTFAGVNLDQTIYGTGVERYRGVFANIHNMGLSMVMYMLVLTIYFVLTERWGHKTSLVIKVFFACVTVLALYCLSKSVVRTAFLTMMVFFGVYFWYKKKLVLVLGFVLVAVMSIVYIEKVQLILFDVISATEDDGDIDKAGSGRIFIWKNNVEVLNSKGFGAWIYGTGVGSKQTVSMVRTEKMEIDSHNDYLAMVMNTGMVGFLLYLTITVLMFRQAMKLPARLKYVFLAYMIAIVLANFFSNAFISRFGLAQIFMMIMGIMYSIVSIERYEKYQAIRLAASVSSEQLEGASAKAH